MTQQAQEAFHQALRTAKAIEEAWERAKALGAIAEAMARAGMTQQAQGVFHQALWTAEAIEKPWGGHRPCGPSRKLWPVPE
jgi:hypothetical protein